jgi:hypothetical protein
MRSEASRGGANEVSGGAYTTRLRSPGGSTRGHYHIIAHFVKVVKHYFFGSWLCDSYNWRLKIGVIAQSYHPKNST